MDDAFRVREWLVEPQLNLIADGSRTTHLEPKVMRVLLCLVEHVDKVVAKERLIHAVWPDTFVTDDVLTHAISQLRRAFGDDAREPRFIQTVPKGGYRLIAPVYFDGREGRGRHRVNRTLLGSAAVLLAGVAVALLRSHLAQRAQPVDSLAVLPFANVDGDPDSDYLGDGITDALIDSLSQVPGLKVISHASVFRYTGRSVDPKAAGRELGVRAVLMGRVRQRGRALSVSAELVDALDNRHIWSESYERRGSDILDVQEDIARTIAERLRPRLTGDEQKRLARRHTESPEAYEAYLKGRYWWNKRTAEGMWKAIDYLHQAIDKDPTYALAYAALADVYVVDYLPLPPKETMPMGKAAAIRALQIDEDLAEAHAALGVAAYVFDWDAVAAEKALKKAIALNPNYATAYGYYGEFLGRCGRFEESLAATKRAHELDPLSAVINVQVGNSFLRARHYDQAVEQYLKTLEMEPGFWLARALLAQAYEHEGMYTEAIQEDLKATGGPPEQVAARRAAYAAAGWKGYWQEVLNSWRQPSRRGQVYSPSMALAYARLGEKDQAFAWLERAYEERRDIPDLLVNPALDGLRSDPRFGDFARRVGWPPEAAGR